MVIQTALLKGNPVTVRGSFEDDEGFGVSKSSVAPGSKLEPVTFRQGRSSSEVRESSLPTGSFQKSGALII